MEDAPNCYDCEHRRGIAGDAHSFCTALNAKVRGHHHGYINRWFFWPMNFDPTWLLSCDSFKLKEE